MNDKYRNFRDLADHEAQDAYRIRFRKLSATLILAPHGGGIEPGTSELAEAIATDDHSLYLFEGLKVSGNLDLHITSANFDEPTCREIVVEADRVIAIHGDDTEDAVVFIGGLDQGGIERLSRSLVLAGFAVKAPDRPNLKGDSKMNVCNRGRTGAGVQLEISDGLRNTFFRALSPRSERQHTRPAFLRFVGAVREALV